jgi:cytoskeletal protein CcmA (bactofilin family)
LLKFWLTAILLARTDIDVDAAQKVQFRDAAIYINSSVDGQLDIVADTEIQIAATTIDINGAINASGEIIAASLDISGNVDVDGITNLDVVDIDGAVQLDATLTVGVDDTGYDVKFYGATGGAYMLWDESADDLILAGAGGLVVAGNVDFNGDLDVDGTTNLDVVDIDGAVDYGIYNCSRG